MPRNSGSQSPFQHNMWASKAGSLHRDSLLADSGGRAGPLFVLVSVLIHHRAPRIKLTINFGVADGVEADESVRMEATLT